MTASVTIVIDQVADALLVPNKAIRSNGGQKTVTVLFEGQEITIPVTVGLIGDSMSQVTSNQLREGDTLVVYGATSSSTASNGDRVFIGGPGEGFEVPAGVFP
jgi:macrolide-specific efflux system membrane fusion protein